MPAGAADPCNDSAWAIRRSVDPASLTKEVESRRLGALVLIQVLNSRELVL
jgi:hypothetical protein